MSLTRPVLFNVSSFDATKDKLFKFDVSAGGSQITANRLIIREQSNNTIVYDGRVESFKYEHLLPANTLTNGKYYNAFITVYSKEGVSLPSAPIQFRCYTQPTLEFVDFPSAGVVNNSSYEFKFVYKQTEGERLNSYIVNLYDVTKRLISTSGNVYVQDGTPPVAGRYLFTGLTDDTAYYVEVVGTTINDASVTTGQIPFNVDYDQPSLFTLLKLGQNCDDGYITITSNITIIDAIHYPDLVVFIGDKEVDLREKGSFVGWPNGYSVDGDFLLRLWFRDPNDYSQIFSFSTADGRTIKVNFMMGYENYEATQMKAYVQVVVSSVQGLEYYIISNYVDKLNDNEYYTLQLRRISDIYEVKLLPVKEAL